MTSRPKTTPSLLDYLKARLARALPNWTPAHWQRPAAWFAALEEEAATDTTPPPLGGEPHPGREGGPATAQRPGGEEQERS
ncbi:MAG: hypothetical protein GXO37_03680, partial [Chloroflexi bacterium]|nr:hypothetical protein [Chloroflexota bacterium]